MEGSSGAIDVEAPARPPAQSCVALERRAICPACHKLLDGDLVETCCGKIFTEHHVFHRACLGPEVKNCPKCSKPIDRRRLRDLYGISFRSTRQETDEDDDADDAEQESRDIIALRREVAELRAKKEQALEIQEKRMMERQREAAKEEEAEKRKAKLLKEDQRLDAELVKQEDTQASLKEQLQQFSERAAILEYMEELHRPGRSQQAASYLEKVITELGSDAWKALTEIRRLKEYYRNNEARFRRDNEKVVRDHARLRAVALDEERAVAGLRSKLKLSRAPSSPNPPADRSKLKLSRVASSPGANGGAGRGQSPSKRARTETVNA